MKFNLSSKFKIKLYPLVKAYRILIRIILNFFFSNTVALKQYENSKNHIFQSSSRGKNEILFSKYNNFVIQPNKKIYNDHFSINKNTFDDFEIYQFDNILIDPYFKIPVYNNKVVVDGYFSFCNRYLKVIIEDSKQFKTAKKNNYPKQKRKRYIINSKKYFYATKTKKLFDYIIISAAGINNYYHWFFEVLAKLYYLENSNLNTKNVIINVNKPFQLDSLKFFPDYTFHFQNEDELVDVENAYLISLPKCGVFPSQNLMNFYREKFLIKLEVKNPKKKVLVLRKEVDGRHFINEDKLVCLLKPLGFIITFLEDLSFDNQVRLFNSAQVVIAAHGAGLTNLIFSNSNTTLVEFYNYKYINTSFGQITRMKNIRHFIIVDQIDYGCGKNNGINADLSFLKTILQCE